MTDYAKIPIGEAVRDGLGHWYLIVAGGPYQYQVQPLTVQHNGTRRPIGPLARMFRSDMRREGE